MHATVLDKCPPPYFDSFIQNRDSLDLEEVFKRAEEMGFQPATVEELRTSTELDKKKRLKKMGFSYAGQFWGVMTMAQLDHPIQKSDLPNYVRKLEPSVDVFFHYWGRKPSDYYRYAPDQLDRAAHDLIIEKKRKSKESEKEK